MSDTHKRSIGVLTYDTINLGDWTQTAATMYVWWVHFNRPDTFKVFVEKCISTSMMNTFPITWINRDQIRSCKKPDGIDEVIIVCNGWWMHKKDNTFQFPPPKWITPIYVSMHIHDAGLLQIPVIKYLQQFQPIGCRDKSTMELLEKRGVSAYFSGCVTMLYDLHDKRLGFSVTEDYSKNIIHIDLPASIAVPDNTIKRTQHHNDISNKNNIIRAVQDLVNYMQSSQLVTTRLHVWLPLASNNYNVVLLNTHTQKEFVNGDADNARQVVNRFTGLTNIVYDKSSLESFKMTLLMDLLTRMDVAFN